MFRFPASVMPLSLRLLGTAAVVCAALSLVGCGGGSRAKEYQPTRMVSFGDENSAFANVTLRDENGNTKDLTGLAYTVNPVVSSARFVCTYDGRTPPTACATDNGATFVAETGGSFERRGFILYANNNYPGLTSPTPAIVSVFEKGHDATTNGSLQRSWERGYSCNTASNWVKYVALGFGFNFPNTCGSGSGAVSYAQDQAKVAQIVAQVSAHANELGEGVLVTLMGGQNDILEQYNLIKAETTDAGKAAAKAAALSTLNSRAVQLAGAVGTIVNSGAKLLIALTPDLGKSPLAAADGTADLLSELTNTFNDAFYVQNVARNYNDGRKVGGIPTRFITDSTAYVQSAAACDTATAVAFTNQVGTTPANPSVLFCTSDTLVSGAYSAVYMWADSTHISSTGHVLIGGGALNRAINQF